jgi:hypothetical protein
MPKTYEDLIKKSSESVIACQKHYLSVNKLQKLTFSDCIYENILYKS